jgi:hypothetical protein
VANNILGPAETFVGKPKQLNDEQRVKCASNGCDTATRHVAKTTRKGAK